MDKGRGTQMQCGEWINGIVEAVRMKGGEAILSFLPAAELSAVLEGTELNACETTRSLASGGEEIGVAAR